ncbi:hypothetical protein EJ04DRAFT_569986 [Polyplosphaeria fusca]|uniref:F-box domain-containing protein n=1 Tax=Polyplosphaeria fusca TaxID=682080 RepID=A0A9P4UV57_9PLEO|nr:hypothetical protein EJ04DRAFT_569986 [Polyplosphaeria fusca]
MHNVVTQSPNEGTILCLATELIHVVAGYLSKWEIKQLRLACKRFADCVELRLSRIYLSPNKHNLNCFRAVVNHPVYRHRVQEIVWDDDLLEQKPMTINLQKENNILTDHLIDILGWADEDNCTSTYSWDQLFKAGEPTDLARKILRTQSTDPAIHEVLCRTEAAIMEFRVNSLIYKRLHSKETKIMARGEDVLALIEALASFPRLRRITLTTEAWRPWYDPPIYDTPFHRSLPKDFQMPFAWPWPGVPPTDLSSEPVVVSRGVSPAQRKREMTISRGWKIIANALTIFPNHQVTELIVDSQDELSGISQQLFQINGHSRSSVELFHRVPLRRLEISLIGGVRGGSSFLHNGVLKQALQGLTAIEHFEFKAGLHPPYRYRDRVPLEMFLPTSQCAFRKLRHLGLWELGTLTSSLVSYLSSLPHLESLFLSDVDLFEDTPLHLLAELRRTFVEASRGLWRESKPRIMVRERIAHHQDLLLFMHHIIYSEINDFLYRNGKSPVDQRGRWLSPVHGVGWIADARNEMDRDWRRMLE